MTNLLGMVNNVRGLLREERVTTVDATNLLTTEIVALVNRAAREVFDRHPWSFLPRRDGRIRFPALESGTAATVTLHSTAASVEFSTQAEARDAETAISYSSVVMRLVVSDDSVAPNVSWRVSEAHNAGGSRLALTLEEEWLGDTQSAAGAWSLFACEAVLPANVQQVFSVYDEDQPLRLEFVDRNLGFDELVPRPLDAFGRPEVVYVGDIQTSTIASRVLFEEGTTGDSLTSSANRTTLADLVKSRAWDDDEWNGKTLRYIDGAAAGERVTITDTTAQGLVYDTTTGLPTSADAYQIEEPGSAVTNISMLFWPIPNTERFMRYSYSVRPGALASATDTWTGVPDTINDLVELRAYVHALSSSMRNDTVMAGVKLREFERNMVKAMERDTPQPFERRIARETVGTRHRGHPNRRWERRVV